MESVYTSMLLFSVLVMSSENHAQDVISIPDAFYLGQGRQGVTPKAFVPGVVSING